MDIASQNLKDDWMYIRFQDCYKTHFLPVDEESNTYELVASAGSFATPIVINHDNPRGFATGDLWTPHPTIPGLWRHTGRKDSMIALSNGLKANTKEIENMLLEDTRISQLLVFGAGRFLLGVIVVPTHWKQNQGHFVEDIWPTVEKINSTVPTYMRLLRGMVLVASPSKPFATTDKNSVKSKETLALYADEIESAYLNLGTVAFCEGPAQTFHHADVLPFIRGIVRQVIGRELSDDANFFEYGVDSLQAIRIWSRLRSLNAPFAPAVDGGANFSTSALYRNPTVSKLTSYVLAQASDAAQDSEDPCEHINALVDLYSSDLCDHTSLPGTTQEVGRYVFLVTGTTGALGCQLLEYLLRRTDVCKIFCLNRPSTLSIVQRQSDSLARYGISYSVQDQVNSGRVVFLDAALAEEDLGLSSITLAEIRSTVTHIIHNAWQLNFNLALDNFTAHFAGVRGLINLSLSSYRSFPPSFIFISSIGATSGYPGAVPETPLDDPTVVIGQTGYSQSKYVAERIIDKAALDAGLPAFIIRCGQLSGSTVNGAWNPQEFIPILLRSSFETGTIPESFPDLRWIPVDVAGEIIVELSIQGTANPQTSRTYSTASYWHVENPDAAAWSEMVERVTSCGRGVQSVSTMEWLESLGRLSSSACTRQQLPAAAALVDFYRQYALSRNGTERIKLDTTDTVRKCPRMASLGSATQWMDKYLHAIRSLTLDM
ncbi:hypothetical protein EWM64_g4730 [Hericium alpestre]|uniref:Carrier domain-containing protein n=1 Tax=Hericium alpestre TaxID=135208 RepID=A0A4Z0A0R3_9AGAM|nr:hypothetical protein EWM64_g4730 [Hericium alpestre]